MESALMLAGGLASAAGQSKGLKYEAAKAERAAQIGRIQADQIDANYRDELNATLANIKALRGGAGVDPDSPTGQAIEAGQVRASTRDRIIDVGSKRMQATQDEADAKFRKRSAKVALFGGAASAFGKNWGGLSDYFGS
ncbi:hypothetical protein [Agrobacterium tumefaciens]|uniref:hypothetical protein n=1 Tax=Agrobacterium tumefaciens TaxID=358 RepID=UPI002FDB4C41